MHLSASIGEGEQVPIFALSSFILYPTRGFLESVGPSIKAVACLYFSQFKRGGHP